MNYSPLRYPGGKAKITPLVNLLMESSGVKNGTYIEPFAGGAGVALALLFNNQTDRIVINDYDVAIYSIWNAIINETDKFVSLIETKPISVEEWREQKKIYVEHNNEYSIELAFATFYLNRTNRSGIIKAGPIGGYDQTGNYLIDARYNKVDLINRIRRIAKFKERIILYNKEIREFIVDYLPLYNYNSFAYFDPPYFKKGKELYKNFFNYTDHRDIAKLICKADIPWMLTYDDENEMVELYKDKYIKRYEINYSAANKGRNKEIIALSDDFWPSKDIMDKLKIDIR
ncbi:MAG: DNA adenine methylase [Clostridia bacterium]|nr:DNA adenine methylase [Clostridia bacterium]